MAILLAGKAYDPAVAGSFATTAAGAVTAAIDATNLRNTFTAPLNGTVRVVQRFTTSGATTNPAILSGVLDGSTIKGRVAPLQLGRPVNAANSDMLHYAEFIVTGLTPGQSYTWDAACGIETGVASSAIKYGGPNNSTINDAWGAYSYEIYDTPGLLASALYDPAGAVNKSITAALAVTAFDTTNLRLTFTGPASGNVIVVVGASVHATATAAINIVLGALDGATVKCRQRFTGQSGNNTVAITDIMGISARMLVTGLTPGTSYTWDAAYGIETVGAAGNISYGGADNTVADDAFGAARFEVWDAAQSVHGLVSAV